MGRSVDGVGRGMRMGNTLFSSVRRCGGRRAELEDLGGPQR